MKLVDILLLGLSLAFIIIGIDQLIVLGVAHAYWAFMVALIPFFVFGLRRARKKEDAKNQPSQPRKAKSGPRPKKG